MDSIFRAAAVYLFLVVLFRLAGRRTLQEISTFDIVLLLIISEATQQALLGQDFSLTAAFLVITTLVGLEIFFAVIGHRFRVLDHVLDSRPEIIVANGAPVDHRLKRHRITESDVLEAAREMHGLERMDQVKFAVLERSGAISIVPVGQAG